MEIDQQIQCKFPKISKNNNKTKNPKSLKTISPIQKMETWPSSRIVRVSRGGKDRHSKVVTSKGLRDRRVRLSVTTAIQFYDLQDRLGFDQPSKALEWLLKAAASSITELPPISTLFLDTPDNNKLLGDEKMSSTSENSKNSELSLCRSEEKDKHCLNLNPNLSQTTSFTELLSSTRSTVKNESDVFDKLPQRNWSSSSPMDYFTSGFLTTPVTSPLFSDQHHQFSFSPEGNKYNNESSEYNLNFTISSSSAANSSGLTGLNRGTLQSNVSNGAYPSFVFENQNHHFFSGQLCFGDAQGNNNNSGQKGKRKN